MAEEELHEIQLNGKQLVFLFMAGTVAAVVIFLCGLMVGRNIRMPQLEAAAATAEPAIADPTRPTEPVATPASSPTTNAEGPVTENENLTYDRLTVANPPNEILGGDDVPADKPSDVAAKTPPQVATPQPAKTPPAKVPPVAKDAKDTTPAASTEPPGNGWTVQVQALNTRNEAEAIARRLSSRNFPAFVAKRDSGKYAVRVGKYPNKRDAEAIKARLEKEEQFKPWITR